MNSKMIVAPSLLAADLGNLKAEIQSVQSAGADWLHIDVMDGKFVPPISFGANIVKTAKENSSLFLDVHLMTESPERLLESFRAAGADRVTVHLEACPHIHRVLETIRSLKMSAGVAINPGTCGSLVFDVLGLADLVLIMTVNPGWGGQKFIQTTLPKVELVASKIATSNVNVLIEVDGGIDDVTATMCRDAGASVMVAGTYIFGSADKAAAIRKLRAAR